MGDRIEVRMVDGVADVRLARADKMNALDDAMFTALIETGAALAADAGVRAVVLSGEGRSFCAGLDMGSFGRMAGGGAPPGGHARLAERTHGIANHAQQAVWAWRLCPVPVIAAVHGVAFGGGFQLALGADIRIVHPEARLSIMEVKWGLVPDMGGTPMMRALAREDVVRELCYTGRIFSGTEARELGFATRVSPDPHAEAMALAAEIAGRSPDAVRGAKEILNALGEATDAEALLRESEVQDRVIGRSNQVEAVMAALEKRAPRFADGR